MALPEAFLRLLSDPAPGLEFSDPRQNVRHVCRVSHNVGEPASAAGLDELRRCTADCPPVESALLEFYTRHDGIDLFVMPPSSGADIGLSIFPIEQWRESTDELLTGDLDFMLLELERMYQPGRFIIIAANENEGTRLALFTGGELDGAPLAGRVHYLAMDPVMGPVEPVAARFHALLKQIGDDPAAFLCRIGWSYTLVARGVKPYSAQPERYVPDIRETQLPAVGV